MMPVQPARVPMRNGQNINPVTEYALKVGDGSIVAGPLVRLACKRHLKDLANGMVRGIWFNEDAAMHAINFFEHRLRFVEGGPEIVGQPFKLQLWQKFIVGSLYGWMGPDGYRRFETAFLEIGKGNGKTPMAAGMALYGLVADDVAGAGVYTVAGSQGQAKLPFDDARELARGSTFARDLQIEQHTIKYPARPSAGRRQSEMKALSKEAGTTEGKRVHHAIADEVHVHKGPETVDSMRDGIKGDPQGMVIEITNSGTDITGICYKHHEYSIKILQEVYVEDNWFAYITCLDKDDDYHDMKNAIKANPNLGVSVSVKYLEKQIRESDRINSKKNVVKRKNFCYWTDADTSWLSTEEWKALAAPRDREELKGHGLALSFDMSSKIDITATCVMFPMYGDHTKPYYTFRFYLPKDNLERYQEPQIIEQLKSWADEGHLILTPGSKVDHDQMKKDMLADLDYYDINDVPYDPWGAEDVIQAVEKAGCQPISVRQNYEDLSDPSKEFEAMIIGGELEHDGNPVMLWCISNVAKMEDTNDNIKPNKARSRGRIDGVLAAVMCTAMYSQEGVGKRSDDDLAESIYAAEYGKAI